MTIPQMMKPSATTTIMAVRRCTTPMSRDLSLLLEHLLPYDILSHTALGTTFRRRRVLTVLLHMERAVPTFVQSLVDMSPDDISKEWSDWKCMIGHADHARTILERQMTEKWTRVFDEAREHFGHDPSIQLEKSMHPWQKQRLRRAFARLSHDILRDDFYLLVRFTVRGFINDKMLLNATKSVRRLSDWEVVTTEDTGGVSTQLLQHRLLPDPRHFLYRVEQRHHTIGSHLSWANILVTTGLHADEQQLGRFLRLWPPDVGPQARPVDDVRRSAIVQENVATSSNAQEMKDMDMICTRFHHVIHRIDIRV